MNRALALTIRPVVLSVEGFSKPSLVRTRSRVTASPFSLAKREQKVDG